MQEDPRDKKPFLESDFTGQVPDETELPDKPVELNEEHDLDDLVHNIPMQEIPLNEEIDADELVHKSVTKPQTSIGNETDPDDLVHGN